MSKPTLVNFDEFAIWRKKTIPFKIFKYLINKRMRN